MRTTSIIPPLKSTPLPMLLLAVTASVAILAAGVLTIDEAGASQATFTTTHAGVLLACNTIDTTERCQ